MKDTEYTVGQVADALRVSLPALRTWAQRGFIPWVDSGEGSWRKFKQDQVAGAAILNTLTQYGVTVGAASTIVSTAMAAVECARAALVQFLATKQGELILYAQWDPSGNVQVQFHDCDNAATAFCAYDSRRRAMYEVGADIAEALARLENPKS